MAKVVVHGCDLFVEFKGALTEQYVLEQLMTLKDIKIFYWVNESGTAEVDFLIDNGSEVIPVEVKDDGAAHPFNPDPSDRENLYR